MLRITVLIVLCLLALPAHTSQLINGYSAETAPFHARPFTELCRVRIENSKNGAVSVSRDQGLTFRKVGNVRLPANSVSYKGYTASKWSHIGSVAATAVNALHIKTDYSVATGRGVVFSLYPKQFYDRSAAAASSNVIYTDIPAGSAIFGGASSPFVENPVYLIRDGMIQQLPKGYVPCPGDDLEIHVLQPADYPREIVFENRFGGRIYLVDKMYTRSVVGVVHSPVLGIGRFLGTQFVPQGRVRANHSGVIDISTSPVGAYGGFQIIPVNHAMSPEMWRARVKTQWMVIGPLQADEPSIENITPFFSSYIRPVYGPDDLTQSDWLQKILQRFLVQVQYDNDGTWRSMPAISYDLSKPLPEAADQAFERVSHIRILFPVDDTTPSPTGPDVLLAIDK